MDRTETLKGLRKFKSSQLWILLFISFSILDERLLTPHLIDASNSTKILFLILKTISLIPAIIYFRSKLKGFSLIKKSEIHEKITLRASQGRSYFIASLMIVFLEVLAFTLFVLATRSTDGILFFQVSLLIPLLFGAMAVLRLIQITGMLGIMSRLETVKNRAISLQNAFWLQLTIGAVFYLVQIKFDLTSTTEWLIYVQIPIWIISVYIFFQLITNLSDLIECYENN